MWRRALRLPLVALQGVQRLQRWLQEDDGTWTRGAPRPLLLFLAVFSGLMLLVTVFGNQGLLAYRTLSTQAQALRQEVSDLQERQRTLTERVRDLRSNPATIERLARQRLGLVKPGDTVLQLAPPRQP
ncbi:MAG TPA: septum formation initiator family protein [bacterium]|nr:septum formation initiator family protein [bacterium]